MLVLLNIKNYESDSHHTPLMFIIWLIGYTSTWVSKWVIGFIIDGSSSLSSIIQQIELRTSDNYKGMHMTILELANFIGDNLLRMNFLYPVLVVFLAILIIAVDLLMNNRNFYYRNRSYLFIFFLFPSWFLILRNHTIQHGWFTWRSILPMIIAGILIFKNYILYVNSKNK